MTDPQTKTPRDRRIVKHIKAFHEAGQDTAKFVEALEAVRDDPVLSAAHRDAIFKTLAQEAAQAYFHFVTGRPVDIEEALRDVSPPSGGVSDGPES